MSRSRLTDELYREAQASAAGCPREAFAAALLRSAAKAGVAEERLETYLRGLRLRDLALATACIAGSESAWKTLLETMRGPLRAAGRALSGAGPGESGEELADALFSELYAARETRLASYAGRSSLAGWLRAVLHQTWIDRVRASKRLVSLEEEMVDPPAPAARQDTEAVEQKETARIARAAYDCALSALPARQKLLLDFYYVNNLTLREAAALVGVHEATASRELDRARRALKQELTRILARDHGLDEQAAASLLLEWDATQESGAPNVLLMEEK